MNLKMSNRLSNLYTFLIVLLPVFGIYTIPGLNIPVSIGEFAIILLLPVITIKMVVVNKSILIRNPFYIYLIYALLSTLIVSFVFMASYSTYSISSMANRVIRDSFYMLLIVFWGKEYFDYYKAVKLIKTVSIILSIYIFAQFLLYRLFGVYLTGFLPNLKTTISGGLISNEVSMRFLKIASYDGYVRANGFMSEPAAAAHFLSTALLIFLFPIKNEKVNFKNAIICSIAMILTFSANAFVALAFCWLLWLLVSKKKEKEILFGLLFVFIVMVFIIPIVLKNDFVQEVIARLTGLFDSGNTQNSAALRVFRGTAFYMEMPIIFQMFGSGFGNFIDFKNALNINTVFEQADEYLNTNSYIAISSGIVGLILYIRSIWKSTKNKYWLAKSIALLVFLYGMSSSIYSSGTFVIMLLLIFNCPRKENTYDKSHNIT